MLIEIDSCLKLYKIYEQELHVVYWQGEIITFKERMLDLNLNGQSSIHVGISFRASVLYQY